MGRTWVAVAAIVACLLPGQAAHASDAVATVSSPETLVSLDGCDDYKIDYDLHLPSDATDWSAELIVTPPDGRGQLGGGYPGASLTSDYNPVAGRLEIFLCPKGPMAGRYKVSVEGTYTSPSIGQGAVHGAGSFRLRKAATHTKFSVSTRTPRFNKPVRLEVLVKAETDKGLKPLVWAEHGDLVEVYLQVKVRGRWRMTDIEFLPGLNGRDNETYRWNIRRTLTCRVLTKSSFIWKRSASAPITIIPRG